MLPGQEAAAKGEAERILAALKSVMADEKVSADKRAKAESILSALLDEVTDAKAEAAKVEALNTFFQVAEIKTVKKDPLIRTMGSGCASPPEYYEYIGENVFGNDLWGYFQQINYCWNNGVLTEVQRERWGNTYWILWYFDGHISNSEYGGVGKNSYRAVTQGHFSYCLAWQGVGCIQHHYPRIDRTVFARW